MRNRIKEFRKSVKLSHEEVAKLCNVSRQTINAIENREYTETPAGEKASVRKKNA
ncbi:helix-turn-helix transcriptional regulator [Cerasibacillus sp. JNUCC 74]